MNRNNNNPLKSILKNRNKDTKKWGNGQPEADISLGDLKKDFSKQKSKLSQQAEPEKTNGSQTKPFPVSAFPLQVQTIISEFYKAYQIPVDFYGLGILTTCSGVIGNAYCLEYKTGFNVPAIIYGAIVGSSSIGKTPALKLCTQPVHKIESHYEKDYKKICPFSNF